MRNTTVRKTSIISIIIYAGRISRYLKLKYNREFGKGEIIKLQSSREISGRSKRRIRRKRQWNSKSGRIKEDRAEK